MREGVAGGSGRPRLAAGLLTALALGGVCAPIIANDRPILARVDGRLIWPALAELPLLGPIFARPSLAEVDWSAPPEGVHPVLRAPVPYSYRGIRLDEALKPPGSRHLLGTDALGRDLLSRLVHGASSSLVVGFGATALALILGVALGALAGLRGGFADLLVVRAIEIASCFPPLVLAMVFVAVSGRGGLLPLITGIALSRWTGTARFVRGETLKQRGGDLWVALRSTGASLPRLAVRHLLPLLAPTLCVMVAFGVAQAIVVESSLSFLGIGVEPPVPSWGGILAEAGGTIEVAWWPVVFPSAFLVIVLGALFAAIDEQ